MNFFLAVTYLQFLIQVSLQPRCHKWFSQHYFPFSLQSIDCIQSETCGAVTLTIERGLESVKVNQHAKYLSQRSFCLKVIVRTDRYTHTADRLLYWTTQVAGNNAVISSVRPDTTIKQQTKASRVSSILLIDSHILTTVEVHKTYLFHLTV